MPHPSIPTPTPLLSWSEAVSSGNLDAIIGHYAQTAALKGTVWLGFVGVEEAETREKGRTIPGYFTALLTGKRDVKVVWNAVKELAPCTYAVDYTFTWIDGEGQPAQLPADATFVVSEEGKILLHHSSPAA